MEAEVSKELECVICQGVMSNPRVLSCQHAFCLRCIQLSSEAGRGSTQVVVKCPYNCGSTEVPDVRSLPKNIIATNLCHALRERTYKANDSHHCDDCSEICYTKPDPATDQRAAHFCRKCAAVLCTECEANDTHAYLCKNDQVFYPFFRGWTEAEEGLQRHLSRRGHTGDVSVINVERVYAPCHTLRVDSTVDVGAARTNLHSRLLSFADGTLPDACRAQVEASDFLPLDAPHLATLFRLQEIRTRQVHLLKSVRNLLDHPNIRKHLDTHSASVDDHVRWDGGCASDCVMLVDMLLVLYKQLCSPVARKIRILSTLEGLRHVRSRPAGDSMTFKSELDRHLRLVVSIEAALDDRHEEEQAVFSALRADVDSLQRRQYAAYAAWQEAVAPIVTEASVAELSGGLELMHRPGAPGDGMVVCRLRSEGEAAYTFETKRSGRYTLSLHYSSPEDTRLTFAVNSTGAVVYVVLAGTGSWGTFGVKHVHEVELREGRNTVRVSLTGCAADPPDVARLSVRMGGLEGNVGVGEAGEAGSDDEAMPPLEGKPPPGGTQNAAGNTCVSATPWHGELLCTLGLCHKMQLEILEALETVFRDSYKQYYGDEAVEQLELKEQLLRREKRDLLYMLRKVQLVRISQRNHYYCVMAGVVPPSFGVAALPPFPTAISQPPAKKSLEPAPNLFATLHPQIQQLQQGQRDSLMREAPQHVQQQIRGILEETMNLLQREQILDLREEVAAVLTATTALLDQHTPPDVSMSFPRHSDIYDLHCIEAMWHRALARANSHLDAEHVLGDIARPGDTTDLGREVNHQLTDRLTRAVMDALAKYISHRHDLAQQAAQPTANKAGGCSLGEAVGATSDNLELHIRTVRELLLAANACGSNTLRLQLLAKLLVLLAGFRSVPQMDMGFKDLLSETRSPQGATAPPSTAGGHDEPLLAWFIRHPPMAAIGFLERCFAPAPHCWSVPQVAHEGDSESRLRCKKRAVALAQAKYHRNDAVLYCLMLQRRVPLNDSLEITVEHSVQDCDLQLTAHVPFYKGTYRYTTAGGDAARGTSEYQFVINGQDGTVLTEYPQRSCLRAVMTWVAGMIRRPSMWFIANGLAIWWRLQWRRASLC